MKKRLMASIMAVTMAAVALTACSSGQTTSTTAAASTAAAIAETTAAAETKAEAADTSAADTTGSSSSEWSKDTPMKLGFAQNKMSVAYRVAGAKQLEDYVKEQGLNWEVIVTDGKNDASTQTANVEDLLSQGVGAMIMCPVTEDTMTPAAQEVMEAGIPLVLTNRKVSDDSAYTAAVTGSNTQIGQLAAADMAEKLDGKGQVAQMLGTVGATDATDRAQGFRDEIAKHPDMQIVAEGQGDFVKDKGMSAMEDILIKYPDLKAVFCANDEMAQGAQQACESAGRTDILIYGCDGYRSTMDMIKAGKITGTALYPTSVQTAVDCLVNYFENGGNYTGERDIVDDVPLVTADNVDEYYDSALDA